MAITSLPGIPLSSRATLLWHPGNISSILKNTRLIINVFMSVFLNRLFIKFQVFYITGYLSKLVIHRVLRGYIGHVFGVGPVQVHIFAEGCEIVFSRIEVSVLYFFYKILIQVAAYGYGIIYNWR